MKHSERFTNAVTNLYNAFHEGTLEYGDCRKCAVGSLCNGEREWANVFCGINDRKPIEQQIRFGCFNGHAKEVINSTGYSPLELANIEFKFMMGSTNGTSITPQNGMEYFKGLCAVIEYLCELEGIPNIMDYTCLFETADDQPKHKLEEVFV